MCAFLGKPFQINSAVFFDNVQKGRGVGESNPCLKIMLQIFYHSKGLFGNMKLTYKGGYKSRQSALLVWEDFP